MLFLTLDSNQPNCSKRENEFHFALHNFDLGHHKLVGLSTVSIDFKRTAAEFDSSIDLSTSLIDRSYYNENGVIHTIPGKNSRVHTKCSIEFWKLDTRKPKNVTFTFRHANVNNIQNFRVTLAFAKSQNEDQVMVRFLTFVFDNS